MSCELTNGKTDYVYSNIFTLKNLVRTILSKCEIPTLLIIYSTMNEWRKHAYVIIKQKQEKAVETCKLNRIFMEEFPDSVDHLHNFNYSGEIWVEFYPQVIQFYINLIQNRESTCKFQILNSKTKSIRYCRKKTKKEEYCHLHKYEIKWAYRVHMRQHIHRVAFSKVVVELNR